MDIETIILILTNLILIETLTGLPKAWFMGALLSEVSEKSRLRKYKFSLIVFPLVNFLIMWFAGWIPLYVKLIALTGLIVLLVYFIFIRKKNRGDLSFIILFWVIVFLEVNDMIGMNPYASIYTPVAFTSNIYLIITGVLFSIITLAFIMYWLMKASLRYPAMKWLGYWFLLVIIAESIFSDMVMSMLPGWHTTAYPLDFILLSLGIILIGYFGIKYLLDKRMQKK